MCGITAAIWSEPGLAIDESTFARMTELLAHRGPDDRGTYRHEFALRPPYESMPGVALGHRRLSILDLACGRQPMTNEDGTIQLVFNGEIYNYRTLRRRLEGSGHRFRSESDSETILHLYEDLGPECLEHLWGMFALVIWDAKQRRVLFARDRLGKKPLVFRQEPGRLLIASELKSILAAPGVPRTIDPAAIDEYLTYQYIPHPNTIFQGIRKLPPAHYGLYADDRLTIAPYWQPSLATERERPEREWIEELRSLLSDAVALRLQSDVPLGVFLSGGIDSSLIAALAQKQSGTPIKTFSIGFPVPDFDESTYARRVAQHLKTDHHELQVAPDAAQILPRLVYHYDEPFADSSALPTWYLAEFAKREVSVALSGDGGDELFAGYTRYSAVAWAAWFDALPWPLPQFLGAGIWQWLPGGSRQKSWIRQFKRFNAAMNLAPERRYLEWISIFGEARRAELYTESFVGRLPNSDPADFVEEAWRRSGPRDAVTCASLADLTTYLPCDLLTKVDIATMAHGLECRQPLLDHRVVELAIAMPASLKRRWGRGKSILRAAFGELLPDEVWTRPKMGFGVPLDSWLRGELRPLMHDLLLDNTAKSRGYFRPEAVQQLVTEHETEVFDHSYRLWALIIFEAWLREWIDKR